MSDASEVKRWWVSVQDQDGRIVRRDVERLCLAGPEPEPEGYEVFIEVMPVEDHDRIVAEKDAEIASLKAQLSMTNSNWPHEKKLHETIAEQKRVIEKLRISMATALELESCGETSCPIPMRAMCSTPSHKELRKTLLEITAIEQKGEGT